MGWKPKEAGELSDRDAGPAYVTEEGKKEDGAGNA